MDAGGNLMADGAHGGGSIFKLMLSGGSLSYTSLHDFTCGRDLGLDFSKFRANLLQCYLALYYLSAQRRLATQPGDGGHASLVALDSLFQEDFASR